MCPSQVSKACAEFIPQAASWPAANISASRLERATAQKKDLSEKPPLHFLLVDSQGGIDALLFRSRGRVRTKRNADRGQQAEDEQICWETEDGAGFADAPEIHQRYVSFR